jgi:ribosome-associated translation inhibitor RaiA
MKIEVNTDNHISGSADLAAEVESVVEATLGHFTGRLTRVEVHLSDENSHKGGDRDKRCAMEARAQGLQPIAVTHTAGTADEAVDGAAEKLKHALETHFGRLESR